MSKLKIICITPVKNEAWILDNYLSAVELWADQVIVAYQNSSDDTLKILKKHPKIRIVYNRSKKFNESERQKLLISEARKIQGKKLIFALDADEFITPNFFCDKNVLSKFHSYQAGTVFRFQWANIYPSFKKYWLGPYLPFAFIDDGRIQHSGEIIHSPRVPVVGANVIDVTDVNILHFQYVDWERMKSKQRWYQVWELINNNKSIIDIYRQYHHMYEIKNDDKKLTADEWFRCYFLNDIDLKKLKTNGIYWWDNDVIKYMKKYGANRFKFLDIWDGVYWHRGSNKPITDPRDILSKIIVFYLQHTQLFKHTLPIKLIDKILKYIF